MRLLRALLAGLAGLLLLAVAAAWFLPGFLDWNRYRYAIEALASVTLNRPVRIEGPVSLTLLPQPVLTASRISVAGGAGLAASELRLRVALGPLLSGRVDARDLVLRGPSLDLPWPLPMGALARRPPAWLDSLTARIEGGRLSVGGIQFSAIDATLTTAASGAVTASGTARLGARAWRFTARLGSPGGDGSASLELTLDGQNQPGGTAAAFAGQIDGDGALSGRVQVSGADLSQLLPAPAMPFRAEGRLTAAAGLAAADDLAVQLGGSPARGAVALRVGPAPRLDVALAASRLDLDAWAPVLLTAHPDAGLPVGVDLSAEAATFAGGTLRRLRCAFDLPSPGITDIREAAAILPGDAVLRLAGRLTRADVPRFAGEGSLVAPDLRATLHWLVAAGAGPPLELPTEALRTAALAGGIAAEAAGVSLTALTGTLDGSSVAGSLSLRRGARPAIAASLRLDRLALDPWLARVPGRLTALPGLLGGFDAEVKLDVAHASAFGAAVEDFALDAVADGARLAVRQMVGNVAGIHATASATVAEGGRVSEGRLDLATADAAAVPGLLPPDAFGRLGRLPDSLWHGPLALQLQAAGPPEALALRLGLDLADARLEAQPVVDLGTGGWSGPVTLRHPGARRLLRTIGVLAAPDWLGEGSLSFVAQLAAGPARIAADSFDLAAGSLRAGGQLAYDIAARRLTGRIAAETLPLPAPDPRSRDPLPVAALRGWRAEVQLEAGRVLAGQLPVADHASASLRLEDGRVTLDRFAGRAAGGVVSGRATIEAADPPRLTLQAAVTGAALDGRLAELWGDLPVGLTAGQADGTAALSASGYSQAALLATLAGEVRVSVKDGSFTGFDLARLTEATTGLRERAIRAALGPGTTAFNTLDATAAAADGVLTLAPVAIDAPGGEAALTGSIDLATGRLALHAELRPAVADPPVIGLRLTNEGRTPELAGLTRWLAERQ